MTQKELLQIAMTQSAIDSSCSADDFILTDNKVVLSATSAKARAYLSLPFFCDLTSYGNNIVASVHPAIATAVAQYITKYPVEHCFETPNLQVLNDALKEHGMCVCFMAEYFLPQLTSIKPLSCNYETRLLTPVEFEDYYLPEWSNALCEARRPLDKLAMGAFDYGKLVGLAGCSADCDTMWQIGIDVLPHYRRQGIAESLTSQLAVEILWRGIVPFYCVAWSNIKSVRTAIKSGFRPSWVQVTAKSIDLVCELNQ